VELARVELTADVVGLEALERARVHRRELAQPRPPGLQPQRAVVDGVDEARVVDRAVVALEVVLDGDLPVARELELAPMAEAELFELDSARGE